MDSIFSWIHFLLNSFPLKSTASYLKEQERWNRTNSIFFRHFRHSLSFQLKTKPKKNPGIIFIIFFKVSLLVSILSGMFSSAFYTFKQDVLLKFGRHLHLNETLWAGVALTEPPRCQNRFRGFYFVAHFKRRPEAANKIFGALLT